MAGINISDQALIDNTSQRLPCVIVLDGSWSMEGNPIAELNLGLKLLEEELKKDDIASQRVQLLIIRFGGEDKVEVISDWQDAMDFSAPTIVASGRSPLGAAVKVALTKIEEQKTRYKTFGTAYNRPWLFILTDGEPTDENWEQVAEQCSDAERAEKHVFFGIGVAGANMGTLAQFSTRKPVRLQGLKFRELFMWLSASASSASKGAQGTTVQISPPRDLFSIPL